MSDGTRELWFTVLERALLDACGSMAGYNSVKHINDARYFLKYDKERKTILDALGINHNTFDCFVKRIEDNGWNVSYLRRVLNKASADMYKANLKWL